MKGIIYSLDGIRLADQGEGDNLRGWDLDPSHGLEDGHDQLPVVMVFGLGEEVAPPGR